MFPSYTSFIALSSLGLLVSAGPLSAPNTILDISKRQTSPCQPGGQPFLYTNYYNNPEGLCGPPKNRLGLDGDNIICPSNSQPCYTYCEVYQYFQYDVEQPVLANPYCHGPLTCTVTDSMAFTYTYTGTFNAGLGSTLTQVLSAGVTGGFSTSSAQTQIVSKSVSLESGQCGYMTFLPELHYSCGTTSKGIWGSNQCNEYSTLTNVCSTQPFKSADGTQVIGTTVFVWTDCSTNERLPMEQQDPAYQHDGVALPQSIYVSTFQTCVCEGGSCSPLSPSCCLDGTCPEGAGVVGVEERRKV